MNIEKTISEHAVSDILTPMLESQDRIVTEDVAPLFEQATGLDTPPASGTVTTTIEESRSVISAIIRKAWTAPLTMLGGASVISYIAAAYTYLRTRLQGNETYGIPDRRSEISASSPLAANLALLNDRKIGEPNAIDGMSLANLLCGSYASLEEIADTNHGWTMSNVSMLSLFTNLSKAKLNCKNIAMPNGWFTLPPIEYDFSEVESIQTGDNWNCGFTYNGKTLYFPNLTYYGSEAAYRAWLFQGTFQEFIAPKLCNVQEGVNAHFLSNPSNPIAHLRKLVLGKLESFSYVFGGMHNRVSVETNLIHFEIGDGTAINLDCSKWVPTMALRTDTTASDYVDLREEGSTAQNNLQQFLSNFRSFIVLRLANRKTTTALTLTISAAVYNAVTGANSGWASQHTLAELGITDNDLTDLETELGITSATIYATWFTTYLGENGINWNIETPN